ncbi:MAG: deoxyguanosinetriphosphate triphosphohydrolase [Burkholderiales bacterium]|nr:deoxyguanosinetriphosphate triphosphohydrolase [Burkholderiales bacterium]
MNLDALAPWAADPRRTRGRRVFEPLPPPRNEHQRDRDRIVHSGAFRRLVYKTQVFVNPEGDLFRTRLTHTLEVAQVARAAARALRLNEDLVEAIALAHDLGHTPFGHAGQDALDGCMRAHGGFEHNLQSLRVVDRLEQRYLAFDGLNLTFETREGILKHCSRRNAEHLLQGEPDGPARRFVDGTQPSLEAQLVNLADEVAYTTHDIDDGVRSGLLTIEQLRAVPLFARCHDAARQAADGAPRAGAAASGSARGPERGAARDAGAKLVLAETLRRILSALVGDLVAATGAALQARRPADIDALRALPAQARFGDELRAQITELERFLLRALYRHPQVLGHTEHGRTVVAELFAAYHADPAEMSAEYEAAGETDRARAVADYIAGMTDRFALREHERLTGRRLFAA